MLGRVARAMASIGAFRRPIGCSSVARQSLKAAAMLGGGGIGCSLALSAMSAPAECAGAAAAAAATAPTNERPIRILCLHGITSDMYGSRGVTYGSTTLAQIDAALHQLAGELGVEITMFSTNEEGAMADRIHEAFRDGTSSVIINPGAWTHYSYGIRDALAILKCPIIEVHMSNMHGREDMRGSKGEEIRQHSVVSPIAKGIVCGFGINSYLLGLHAAVTAVRAQKP